MKRSDCLTKRKGNSAPLLEMLRTGKYQLVVEEEELHRRKEEREKTGKRNARPKRMTLDDPKGRPASQQSSAKPKRTIFFNCADQEDEEDVWHLVDNETDVGEEGRLEVESPEAESGEKNICIHSAV